MGVFDLFFNFFFGIFFLLSIGVVIFGVLIIFKPLLADHQSPILEPWATRVLGIILVALGLGLFMYTSRYLFEVQWPDIQLISASAVILFFSIMGILTILGRPFLAANLIPKSLSRRALLGIFSITCGVLGFFRLSEDYWPKPGDVQDLIVLAIFFLLFFSPVLISRLRRQGN